MRLAERSIPSTVVCVLQIRQAFKDKRLKITIFIIIIIIIIIIIHTLLDKSVFYVVSKILKKAEGCIRGSSVTYLGRTDVLKRDDSPWLLSSEPTGLSPASLSSPAQTQIG